jgi:hypothetical protein
MTNTIYAYGEDSMTLALLRNNLGILNEKLEAGKLKKINPYQSNIFYRPSFGRGRLPSFGEFDAIVATPQVIYLIESKWQRGSETIKLEDAQINRHRKFAKYYSEYKKCKNWEKFDEKVKNEHIKIKLLKTKEEETRLKMPSRKTQLYKNMKFVFENIRTHIEARIINLLIVFNGGQNIKLKKSGDIEITKIILNIQDKEWFELEEKKLF